MRKTIVIRYEDMLFIMGNHPNVMDAIRCSAMNVHRTRLGNVPVSGWNAVTFEKLDSVLQEYALSTKELGKKMRQLLKQYKDEPRLLQIHMRYLVERIVPKMLIQASLCDHFNISGLSVPDVQWREVHWQMDDLRNYVPVWDVDADQAREDADTTATT